VADLELFALFFNYDNIICKSSICGKIYGQVHFILIMPPDYSPTCITKIVLK